MAFPLHVPSSSFFVPAFLVEYSQLKECLAALDSVCAVDATEALETLSIYIDNIHRNPHDKKFRTIRISNIAFQERIGHLNGMQTAALQCLCVARHAFSLFSAYKRSKCLCLFCVLIRAEILYCFAFTKTIPRPFCFDAGRAQATFSNRSVSRRSATF